MPHCGEWAVRVGGMNALGQGSGMGLCLRVAEDRTEEFGLGGRSDSD